MVSLGNFDYFVFPTDKTLHFQEAKGPDDRRRRSSFGPPNGQRGDELEQQLLDHDIDGFDQGDNSIDMEIFFN